MPEAFVRYRPYLVMMFLFALVLVGTVWILQTQAAPPRPALLITTPTPRATATPVAIIVEVRGAIKQPGVYTLPLGSRVQDALALAGDALDTADTRPLNLARKLNDGEQLYVPARGETPAAPIPATGKTSPTAAAPKTAPSKINLNTATLAELDTLPGIGPAIAQRILDYRAQNGEFKKIEDVKKVRGIGDAMFEQIKDLITTQ